MTLNDCHMNSLNRVFTLTASNRKILLWISCDVKTSFDNTLTLLQTLYLD